MPDLTYREVIEELREAVSTVVMKTLDQADTLTVGEALEDAIPDEAMRYQTSLVALPSRVLGVLVIAE